MISGREFEKNLKIIFEKANLIDRIHEEGFTEEIKSLVKLVCEDRDKFIDVYLKEERRKAGCNTYQDSKGRYRMIDTDELHNDYINKKLNKKDLK
jgi:hypothetical protein